MKTQAGINTVWHTVSTYSW